MLKTYDVTCPDCTEEFEVEMDPATEDEYIDCPECRMDFDWEYDEASDTVTLIFGDDNEIDDEIDDTPLADDDEGGDELL